jgi:ribosomal protein S18 acetylase RimI-like enzyme
MVSPQRIISFLKVFLMEAIIRRAKSSDIPHLVELLRELFSIEADFEFNAGLQEQGLSLMIESPSIRCVMVVEVDKKVVGMCTGQLLVSTAKGGFSGLIEDLVINQKFQRKGLGIRLLDAVEKWCINKGAQRIQLLADKNNTKALAFYEKCHWQKTQLICLRKTGDGP